MYIKGKKQEKKLRMKKKLKQENLLMMKMVK